MTPANRTATSTANVDAARTALSVALAIPRDADPQVLVRPYLAAMMCAYDALTAAPAGTSPPPATEPDAEPVAGDWRWNDDELELFRDGHRIGLVEAHPCRAEPMFYTAHFTLRCGQEGIVWGFYTTLQDAQRTVLAKLEEEQQPDDDRKAAPA